MAEAMAGNAQALIRFVGFSSHRYTLPNLETRWRTRYATSKAPRDTTSALVALSRQTLPASNIPVPPSQPSVSCPPCVLSWHTLRRLKLAG